MNFIDQLLLGLAVSMDAFAVSICLGLSTKNKKKQALEAFLWFGLAQAFMALGGFFLGTSFASKIQAWDHWVAFGLLILIGFNMLKEAIEDHKSGGSCERKTNMLMLSIATSIDSFAIGISISMLTNKIISPALIIGFSTGIISACGVIFGNILGAKNKYFAELAGSVILILLGVKILVEAYI